MKIISVNSGKKKNIQFRGNTYSTGIFKYSVEGSLFLGTEGLDTDEVIDRKHHGGIDMAVYAYGYNHYPYWEEMFPKLNLGFGFMGENLTVSHLDETKIYIGDIFELGQAVVQATKPRQPCFKLGVRFEDQSIIPEMWKTTKSGVYFRVLQTGNIQTEDELKLIEKAKNSPSVAEVFTSKRS